MGVKTKGIDISRWQNPFNLAKAKAEKSLDFVIIKFGGADGGLYKDRCAEDFYKQAEAAGMPKGAYFYGNAMNVQQAEREADYFISLLKDHKFEYPVFYDVEGAMLSKTGRIDLTNIVTTFCDRLEKAGYWAGIYSSLSAYNSEMNDKALARFSHWVACWVNNPVNVPKLKSGNETQMWQWSSSQIIQGKRVDTDLCFVDYPKYVKSKGLNGYVKPKKTKSVKEAK